MLRWVPFFYWTLLGVFHGLLFFFGVRFLFGNPALQANGQVRPLNGRYSNWTRKCSTTYCYPMQTLCLAEL